MVKRTAGAVSFKKEQKKSVSSIDVGIIAETLLFYTTPCFEALTTDTEAAPIMVQPHTISKPPSSLEPSRKIIQTICKCNP